MIHRGTVDRSVHAPPIGLDRTQLFIQVPQLECHVCQRVLNAKIPQVEPLCQYTKSFARLAIDLRKMMTNLDVSRYLGAWGHGMGTLHVLRIGNLRRVGDHS